MSKLDTRITKLEKNIPAAPGPQIADDQRLMQIRSLSHAIAREARELGITAQDDPRLALPLAMAEVIHEQP